MNEFTPYLYTKGTDAALDAQLAAALMGIQAIKGVEMTTLLNI